MGGHKTKPMAMAAGSIRLFKKKNPGVQAFESSGRRPGRTAGGEVIFLPVPD
jgi:hypothetical protein